MKGGGTSPVDKLFCLPPALVQKNVEFYKEYELKKERKKFGVKKSEIRVFPNIL